jgi:hypothetical protein
MVETHPPRNSLPETHPHDERGRSAATARSGNRTSSNRGRARVVWTCNAGYAAGTSLGACLHRSEFHCTCIARELLALSTILIINDMCMVLEVGVEPTCPEGRGILSPVRLPVPPLQPRPTALLYRRRPMNWYTQSLARCHRGRAPQRAIQIP